MIETPPDVNEDELTAAYRDATENSDLLAKRWSSASREAWAALGDD